MKRVIIIASYVGGMIVLAEQGQTNQIAALASLPPMQQVQAVERIWTNDPAAYFKTVTETFKNRSQTDKTLEYRQAVWTAFTNALHHPIPTNDPALATTCLGEKLSVFQIHTGWPLPEYELESAYVLGEIRSLRTYDPFKHPLYNSWIDLPGHLADRPDITNDVQRAAYLQKADENRRNLDSDMFQRELWSQDRGLTFSLFHSVPTFRGKIPDYTNYVNQISAAAHLTDEEKNRLLGIKKP